MILHCVSGSSLAEGALNALFLAWNTLLAAKGKKEEEKPNVMVCLSIQFIWRWLWPCYHKYYIRAINASSSHRVLYT